MTRRNEGLSGNELAAIVGITANRRSDWARKGLLRQASTYGPLDAIDLACLGALVEKVGPKCAKRCWPTIRQALRDSLPNRRSRMWAVIDERPAAIQLVGSPLKVVTAASIAPGAISVLAIHEIADRTLSAYRRAVPGGSEEPRADIHNLDSRRRKSSSM